MLSGSVIDEHDQSPLDFATVYIVELAKGVVAGDHGNYQIEDLCAGKYTLVVSHVSCQPDTLQVEIHQNTNLNLFLEHHAEALKQITITGQEIETSLNSDQQQVVGIGTLDSLYP